MIHTILFDAGGTMVNGKSTLIMLAEVMSPVETNQIADFMIKEFMTIYSDEHPERFYTIKELLALAIQKAAVEFGVPDISDQVPKYYRKNHLEQGVLFDDTIPVLEKLKRMGTKMVLVSDADADVLVEQLEAFGILDYFSAMVISSHVGAYKPSDLVVREAARYCHEPYSGILMVGDKSKS